MKKGNFRASFLLILAVLLMAGPFHLLAAANDVGFTVQSVIPDNQRDRTKTYFDLRVAPKLEQELQVVVSNTSEREIRVAVEVITASTSPVGTIDYKTKNIYDSSLQYNLFDLITIPEPILTIPANSTATATLELKMPSQSYDGVLLGGISFTKLDDENAAKPAEGVVVSNVFSYVVGLVLNETDTVVKPDFEALEVQPELVNYRSAIVHSIRNKQPLIIKELKMDLVVVDRSNDQVLVEETRENIEFAPNSLMNYPLYLSDGPMKPGEYLSKITLTYQEETWNFDIPFTIAAEKASSINDGVLVKPYNDTVVPTWVWIALGGLGVLLILLLVMLIVVLTKKKKHPME